MTFLGNPGQSAWMSLGNPGSILPMPQTKKLKIIIYFTYNKPESAIPVVNAATEEECFPIFTDVEGSIDLFDMRGEAIIMDEASVSLHRELLDRNVSMSWEKTDIKLQ